MTTERETLLKNFIESVERIAFDMKPPNEYTPRLVGLCEEARARLLAVDAKLESQQGSSNDGLQQPSCMPEPVGEIRKYKLICGDDGGYVGLTEVDQDGKSKIRLPVDPGGSILVKYVDHLQAMRARVPEGWQLVPKEPSYEQRDAGIRSLNKSEGPVSIYKSMLAAAPKPE